MPPPSQLSIATSSVQRLLKEEASYHKELEKQQAHLKSLEDNPDGDENAEFQLRQEKLAIEQTLAVFPHLRHRITGAAGKLKELLATQESGSAAVATSDEETTKAKEVLEAAKEVVAEKA